MLKITKRFVEAIERLKMPFNVKDCELVVSCLKEEGRNLYYYGYLFNLKDSPDDEIFVELRGIRSGLFREVSFRDWFNETLNEMKMKSLLQDLKNMKTLKGYKNHE